MSSALTLDNSVFLFGEFLVWKFQQLNASKGGYHDNAPIDDILEYDGSKWLNVGKMKTPRSGHSVALLTDASKICP